jgi:hypothetical protein
MTPSIVIGLLAMNPAAAFPVMMGSCAFLMPAELQPASSVWRSWPAARQGPRRMYQPRRSCSLP